MNESEWSEDRLLKDLRGRYYPAKGYVVIDHLRDGPGFSSSGGHIDAAVFSVWPSQGLYRMAVEIKICKADFRREISKPGKSQWSRNSFNEFWFLAPPKTIDIAELPKGTGLMEPHGSQLRIVRAAEHNASAEITEELLATIVARIPGEAKTIIEAGKSDDPEYKRLKEIEAVIDKFLGERMMDHVGVAWRAEEVYKDLHKAVQNNRAEADSASRVMLEFQKQIMQLWQIFSVLAAHSLQEVDRTGKALTPSWGPQADMSISSLIKDLKQKKNRIWGLDKDLLIDVQRALDEMKK